jgi:hypothetical protein
MRQTVQTQGSSVDNLDDPYEILYQAFHHLGNESVAVWEARNILIDARLKVMGWEE